MIGLAPFFEELVQSDRKLELDYEYATAGASAAEQRVREAAASYLEGYAAFNGLSKEASLESYSATIRRYAKDIRTFMSTGRYPLEINPAQAPVGRTDYDLFLILTILVTRHRCALMAELADFPASGASLVIGVGSGIELTFLQAGTGGDAYDLYINGYAREAIPDWRFHEDLYRASGRLYDSIYAIELLEHLNDPYALLSECIASLAPGGKLVVTTAANVPQFDHRYNFVSDEDFEWRAGELGLVQLHKRVIPHAYARTEIGACNAFYVFVRKD